MEGEGADRVKVGMDKFVNAGGGGIRHVGSIGAADAVAALINKVLTKELDDLCTRNPAALVRYRNQKIRKAGHWNEG
jgi:hypothetical protein